MNETENELMRSAPSVLVKVIKGQSMGVEKRFTSTFLIGRSKTCDLRIMEDCISRNHVQVIFEGGKWRLKDMGSANGTFLNGHRITEAPLPDSAQLELGTGGPVLLLTVERPIPPKAEEPLDTAKDITSETQIIKHYFDKKGSEDIGEQTMMFRRAFERVHKIKSKKYLYIIGAVFGIAVIMGIAATAIIHHQKQVILQQKQKLEALIKTAENIFYAMKSLEIQISQLEDIVLLKADPKQVTNLLEKRKQLDEMSRQYDNFVTEIGAYKKAPVEKRIILKMARIFGECDVNVPESFEEEVLNYIARWRSTGSLQTALKRAEANRYTEKIVQALKANNLPGQFMFLALRESEFYPRAVGKLTRYGYAKGMWQFIPETAQNYGLKIGPLYQEPVYDDFDERFNVDKATKAAVKYLRDINNTEAQASGLLVMASYNWGENNIRKIIARMPENPRDRNFWRLLNTSKVPQETYDYVLYIFSAAVICENPRLFGFDFDAPQMPDLNK